MSSNDLLFTCDVVEFLLEKACDKCHFPFICSEDELDDKCRSCELNLYSEFIEEAKQK